MAYKNSKERLDSDINYSKVLFLHINRTAMSDSQPIMDINVKILETLLVAWLDKEYNEEIEKAKQTINNEKAMGKEDGFSDFTHNKFQSLIKLAERKNLLLDKEVEGIDPRVEEGYDATGS